MAASRSLISVSIIGPSSHRAGAFFARTTPIRTIPVDLKADIQKEISRVNAEIDQQRKLIKHHIDNKLMIETAEQEMKALHTRLSVLEANLAKQG